MGDDDKNTVTSCENDKKSGGDNNPAFNLPLVGPLLMAVFLCQDAREVG